MESLYLYGAGGHAKVVAEIAEKIGYTDLIFCEDNPGAEFVLGYPVESKVVKEDNCVIAIGNNVIRKKLAVTLSNPFVVLIHPAANISPRATIQEGTVVMAGVSINSKAMIGKHGIINTNASVDHDCILEDYVHISPNAALAGNVSVGEGTHIGIGACVIQGVKIGKWCTIGAGTVVIKDIPDGCTVVGNPGSIIKQKSIEGL
ncbi:acetyltransferase [Sphingobacterium lumbrici]|uniref:acetyltransferase n=1 Tax=Sphingobacterium lumbrici TaxID=2559600 RepID=UPI00112683A7|nr:acetyltransferase [Sphingobacterium lumbrici]